MKHKRAGRLCMLAGALCILLGAGLTGYNLYTDQAAEEQSEQVLAQLRTACSLPRTPMYRSPSMTRDASSCAG